MKACVLKNKNTISFEEITTPEINHNEVLINIKACGICSSDFERVYKDSAYFYPIILGHEFSGKVVKCDSKEDEVLIDKKVTVFPLIPCQKCEFCKEKLYAQCVNYNYFGSRCNGAMSEYISVPSWNIKVLPDEIKYEIGALCEPTAVAINATNKIDNFKNKKVCIIGNGIIGIISGIIAEKRGAKVFFKTRNSSKENFLKELGFSHFFKETEEKFDSILECVGTNNSITTSVELAKPKGTIIYIGNPKEDIIFEKKLYWKILRSELIIKGVWNSNFKNKTKDNWDLAINFLHENEKIIEKIITHKFNLKDEINAFEKMKNETGLCIKGIFIND